MLVPVNLLTDDDDDYAGIDINATAVRLGGARFGRWMSAAAGGALADLLRNMHATIIGREHEITNLEAAKLVATTSHSIAIGGWMRRVESAKAAMAEGEKLLKDEIKSLKDKLWDASTKLAAAKRNASRTETRLDAALAEARKRKGTPIAIVMSPDQFREFGQDGYRMAENKIKATSGERYAYSYEGVPIWTAEGFHGPVVLDTRTIAGFAALKEAFALREM